MFDSCKYFALTWKGNQTKKGESCSWEQLNFKGCPVKGCSNVNHRVMGFQDFTFEEEWSILVGILGGL